MHHSTCSRSASTAPTTLTPNRRSAESCTIAQGADSSSPASRTIPAGPEADGAGRPGSPSEGLAGFDLHAPTKARTKARPSGKLSEGTRDRSPIHRSLAIDLERTRSVEFSAAEDFIVDKL